MRVCVGKQRRVYKPPAALSLWWFQSAKVWPDCTKREKYELSTKWTLCSLTHMHIYIYGIQTYTPILCIPVWLRLWIIDVFIICPSCALQTSRSFCSPVSQSLSLILFHVSLPQDAAAAAASVKPWLDEERTIDYQYGPAPSRSFPPSLALRYATAKCFSVFLVVVTENKGLFLFFIFFLKSCMWCSCWTEIM